MNNQFDELARSMAQTTTRRAAMKTQGVGLAGLALAAFGLRNAKAAQSARYTCCVYQSFPIKVVDRVTHRVTFLPARVTKVCIPPGATCETYYGAWDGPRSTLFSQSAVADRSTCK